MAKTEKMLNTGTAPEVRIEVAGDLALTGWDEAMVMARAGSDAVLDVWAEGEAVGVRCDGDCAVRVPRAGRVRLVVRGDAQVADVAGGVVAGEVNGDLALRRVGPVEMGSVAGDLAARGVAGDLRVGAVAGDAAVVDVAGSLSATGVAADLAVRTVRGRVEASCGADAALSIDAGSGADWDVRAGADIRCRVAPTAAARFELVSGTGDVQVRLPGAAVDVGDGGTRRVSLGEDGPLVRLQAGSDIALVMDGPRGPGEVNVEAVETDMARLAGDIERAMGGLAERIAQSMRGAGLSDAEAERVAERVREAQDRALRHAQHHVERAGRRAERHARRGWGRRGAQGAEGRPERPAVPPQPAPPVTTEAERAAVLRMLSEQRITREEAGRLLDALEGR